jgi:hypothetical protein
LHETKVIRELAVPILAGTGQGLLASPYQQPFADGISTTQEQNDGRGGGDLFRRKIIYWFTGADLSYRNDTGTRHLPAL